MLASVYQAGKPSYGCGPEIDKPGIPWGMRTWYHRGVLAVETVT